MIRNIADAVFSAKTALAVALWVADLPGLGWLGDWLLRALTGNDRAGRDIEVAALQAWEDRADRASCYERYNLDPPESP